MSATAYRIGDLRARRLTWHENVGRSGLLSRLRIGSPTGRPATLDYNDPDCCELYGGAITGGHVYWAVKEDRATIRRRRTGGISRSQCWHGRDGLPFEPGLGVDFAVDGRRIIYADGYGIFELDRKPFRWRAC